MAELKTQKNDASVEDFLNSVQDDTQRKDSFELLKIFEECTGAKPVMWGSSIIGYGTYHYKSERSSQEGDWPLTGFSPRKQNLTLYIMDGFDTYDNELAKLGKYKKSKSCLYIKRLSDVDVKVLRFLIEDSAEKMRIRYEGSW